MLSSLAEQIGIVSVWC